MRLIDADKAGAELACYNSPTGIVDEALYEFASDIINEAPTVEAIPIEWMERWSFRNQSMNYGNGRNCTLKLLNDWEKENDK